MEVKWLNPSLILLLLPLFIIKFIIQTHKKSPKLPPTPISLPFIGHLHLLKIPLHRTLQKLSQKHGPLISLKFGSRSVIIVSSASLAEECFTKNDMIFANRPLFLMGKYLGYNGNTMVTAPYGQHFRNLRKISLLQLLSTNRLNMTVSIRRDEMIAMIGKLNEGLNLGFGKVELKWGFRVLVFNVLLRMLAGKRYYGEDVVDLEEAKRFTDVIRQVLELAGASNPLDFVPVLRWIDYGGYIKRIKGLATETDGFLQALVDEHRSGAVGSDGEETLISRLILLQESDPEYYTDETIKGLILVSFLFLVLLFLSFYLVWILQLLFYGFFGSCKRLSLLCRVRTTHVPYGLFGCRLVINSGNDSGNINLERSTKYQQPNVT